MEGICQTHMNEFAIFSQIWDGPMWQQRFAPDVWISTVVRETWGSLGTVKTNSVEFVIGAALDWLPH
jgi:hypothetical protein